MNDYKSYSCSNFLVFLDRCESASDHIDAKYLLSMQDATSIKKMIDIYDNVLWKFILKYMGLGKEENIPASWYDIYSLPKVSREYWWSLNTFLNENIERLFNSQKYTDELSFACIMNLREAPNHIAIRDDIISKSSVAVNSVKDMILSSLAVVTDAPSHISHYNLGSKYHEDLASKYSESMRYLESMGYVKSIKEKTFERKNEIKNPQEKKRLMIFIVVFALIMLLSLYIFTKIDLMTIIILIGAPGALISMIKKG